MNLEKHSPRSGVLPLRDFLEKAYAEFHRPVYLNSDPILFIHEAKSLGADLLSLESIALISALLAYGNVKQIQASVRECFKRMARIGSTPALAIQTIGRAKSREWMEIQQVFQGWKHRFQTDSDLLSLLILVARSAETYRSLGAHFQAHYLEDQPTFERALIGFIGEWKQWSLEDERISRAPGFYFLLNSPSDGSCCKRWCMFLRWMGRQDAIDPGLWTHFLKPAQLVIPLDTHTTAIAQALGLTKRQTTSWRCALEVTDSLRAIDPEDPVRFDFALARLGIVERCKKKFVSTICPSCELFANCRMIKKR